MNIIITGANGFLAKTLRRQLQKTNHIIIPVVRKKIVLDDVVCDIGNVSDLIKILNEYNPEVIINCAAVVNFSNTALIEQYNTNALAPSIMASWCIKNNAHLLQTSSSIVNGNQLNLFDIDSPELPINHYGHTKLLADNAIKISTCQNTIIRFGGIFGENGPAHLGINVAINNAKSGKTPNIVALGLALRNYIHVEDAAKLLIYCMDNKIFGLHYAGSHQSISIANMLTAICNIYLNGVKPNYKNGQESIDQVTKVSKSLPKTLPFELALKTYQ